MAGNVNSTNISFSSKQWQIFRALIVGALDGMKAVLGDELPWLWAALMSI
jgi:hypothetical protein